MRFGAAVTKTALIPREPLPFTLLAPQTPNHTLSDMDSPTVHAVVDLISFTVFYMETKKLKF